MNTGFSSTRLGQGDTEAWPRVAGQCWCGSNGKAFVFRNPGKLGAGAQGTQWRSGGNVRERRVNMGFPHTPITEQYSTALVNFSVQGLATK